MGRPVSVKDREMTQAVITWNTHKTDAGYAYRVYTVGYRVASETLREGVCATRAIAVHRAKAWLRYYNAQARRVG